MAQKKIRDEDVKRIADYVTASKTPVTTEGLVKLIKEQSA